MKEMHENDHESFYKYFRMTPERFDNLLVLVGPMLSKKSLYREPISAGERLSVTLRFLATGDSQQTISFSYRIGLTTVSNIIAETCDALWIALPDYITSPSKPLFLLTETETAVHAFSFFVLFLQLGFEVFQRIGYFLTSSINKASTSE